MQKFVTGAAIAALVSMSATPVLAQAANAQAANAQATTAAAGIVTLTAGTPINLAMAEEINSSTQNAGDTFKLTVLEDVKVGDTIVIPRGTPAMGEVTWRTGKGAFGKSGKLEFAMRSIELGGQMIPVSGNYRQEGDGNTIATGVAIVAAGLIGGLVVTGKRARVPMGRELMSQTAQPVPFSTDGHLAAGYDGKAAMATTDAKTPLGECRTKAAALPEKKQKDALKACFLKRMD